MINFNKNSWHRQTYNALYTSEAPDNLCPYFWKVVWAIITMPAWCIMSKIHKRADATEKIWIGGFLTFLAFVISIASSTVVCDLFGGLIGDSSWVYYFSPIIIILLIALFIAFFIGFVVLSVTIEEKWKDRETKESTSLLGAKFKSWKDKNCPKINWK